VSVLFVTGTDTGVGKTVTTAALACHARLAGIDVAVCKPVQTGTRDGDDDLAEIARLARVTELHSLAKFPEPLAPRAAAERAGATLPGKTALIDLIAAADRPGRLTLVEGAGGLLVEIGADATTLRDLAAHFDAPVLTVVASGLGTLNHTVLTLEALSALSIAAAGLVIGSWPAHPGTAEIDNRDALARLAPVRAAFPAGVASLGTVDFERISAQAFDLSWVRSLL
jgi:dethiobiotin synthetase